MTTTDRAHLVEREKIMNEDGYRVELARLDRSSFFLTKFSNTNPYEFLSPQSSLACLRLHCKEGAAGQIEY